MLRRPRSRSVEQVPEIVARRARRRRSRRRRRCRPRPWRCRCRRAASAGRVVGAVADHGDRVPLVLQSAHQLLLVVGHDLGAPLVDTELGRHRGGGVGVVAGEQHDAADTVGAQCVEHGARLRSDVSSRRLTSPTSLPSTASSSGVSDACCRRRTQSCGASVIRTSCGRSSSARPSSRIRPSLSTRMPCPTQHLALLVRRDLDVPFLGVADHRLRPAGAGSGSRSWPRRASTCSGDQSSSNATTLVTTGRPRVSVPVLSNTTASTRPACLEVGAALDEDAAAGTVADRGADRGRGREADRARAGDQQHRHRPAHVAGGERVEGREREGGRHEAAGEVLPDGLDRGPVGLGLLDPGDDPSDRGVAADGGRAHHEPTAQQHRAGRQHRYRPRR